MKFKYLLFAILLGSSLQISAQLDPCDCVISDSTTYVCAQDSFGHVFPLPNECFVACLGFTLTDLPCDSIYNPWQDTCNCTQEYNPVCVQDSFGNYFEMSNACYAACYGFTVVTDSTLCGFNPWGDCVCTQEYNPVCAQDSLGNYFLMPNACFAGCYGYVVVTDSTLCDIGDPWGDCLCTQEYIPVCAQDSLGNTFTMPNACIAICYGFTIVDSTECDYVDPWAGCDCPINDSEPFVCAQDSLGHACYVPNVCYANCLGLTIVSDTLCSVVDIDTELDSLTITCLQNIDLPASGLFQEFLLAISQSCNLALPACIVDAPIFANDSLFIDFIINSCDGNFGFNGNNTGSNFMNLYNFANASVCKSDDIAINKGFDIKVTENPVRNTLRYSVTTAKETNVTAKIMNINGQIIHSEYLRLQSGQNEVNTNVDGNKPGIYIINFTGAKINKTIKFVVAE